MDFTNTTDNDDTHNTESLLVLSLGIMLVFACIVRYCDYKNKTQARRNVLIHHNINNDRPQNIENIENVAREVVPPTYEQVDHPPSYESIA